MNGCSESFGVDFGGSDHAPLQNSRWARRPDFCGALGPAFPSPPSNNTSSGPSVSVTAVSERFLGPLAPAPARRKSAMAQISEI
jgi:hypothetical protein